MEETTLWTTLGNGYTFDPKRGTIITQRSQVVYKIYAQETTSTKLL